MSLFHVVVAVAVCRSLSHVSTVTLHIPALRAPRYDLFTWLDLLQAHRTQNTSHHSLQIALFCLQTNNNCIVVNVSRPNFSCTAIFYINYFAKPPTWLKLGLYYRRRGSRSGPPVTYDTLWIWSTKFWGLKVCRCRLGWNRKQLSRPVIQHSEKFRLIRF